MRIIPVVMLLAASTASGQSAGTLHKALSAEATRIEAWASEKVFVDSAAAQNARKVPRDEIRKVDDAWQSGSVRKEIMTGPCADRIRELMRQEDYYLEAFLSDNQGALVCANAPTSDYWQGDEAKWSRAFDEGRGAVFIDRPRYDESAKATLGFISLPVRQNGEVLGVLTVGVVAEKLTAASQ